MSQKQDKRARRVIRKFNKQVFQDFTIEVSCMPFWNRLGFCLKMAFLLHELQKGLKPEIEARRNHAMDGTQTKPVHRSFRLTRKEKVK